MYCIEGKARPGYVNVSPFGKEWEPVTLSVEDSMVADLDEAIDCVRHMWDSDRTPCGAQDSMYRVRRVSDQSIVFDKGL